jgi:hypothetical protein
LIARHQAGRRLIDTLIQLANMKSLEGPSNKRDLVDSMQQYETVQNWFEWLDELIATDSSCNSSGLAQIIDPVD